MDAIRRFELETAPDANGRGRCGVERRRPGDIDGDWRSLLLGAPPWLA